MGQSLDLSWRLPYGQGGEEEGSMPTGVQQAVAQHRGRGAFAGTWAGQQHRGGIVAAMTFTRREGLLLLSLERDNWVMRAVGVVGAGGVEELPRKDFIGPRTQATASMPGRGWEEGRKSRDTSCGWLLCTPLVVKATTSKGWEGQPETESEFTHSCVH